jgi:hypothetical protein
MACRRNIKRRSSGVAEYGRQGGAVSDELLLEFLADAHPGANAFPASVTPELLNSFPHHLLRFIPMN